MKIFYIYYLSLLVASSCTNRKENVPDKTVKQTQNSEFIDSTFNTQSSKKPKFIAFEDGELLNSDINYWPDEEIDSISSRRKFIIGNYFTNYKGPINMSLFEQLKKEKPDEYNNIKAITTGHAIITGQSDTVDFSGLQRVVNFPKGTPVKVSCLIYELYAKDSLITNIFIIEKMDSIPAMR